MQGALPWPHQRPIRSRRPTPHPRTQPVRSWHPGWRNQATPSPAHRHGPHPIGQRSGSRMPQHPRRRVAGIARSRIVLVGRDRADSAWRGWDSHSWEYQPHSALRGSACRQNPEDWPRRAPRPTTDRLPVAWPMGRAGIGDAIRLRSPQRSCRRGIPLCCHRAGPLQWSFEFARAGVKTSALPICLRLCRQPAEQFGIRLCQAAHHARSRV